MGVASVIQYLAWFAISAVAVHATATLLLHWFVPSVNPFTEMVSAYLNSDYQWLSRLTFVALACAFGFLGLSLVLRQIQGASFVIAVVLTAIAVIGLLGVAVAPGLASSIARPTQPVVVVAILLFSLVLRNEGNWQAVGSILLSISLGLIALFVATILLGALASAGFGGLANRIALVLIYAWVLLVARGLLMSSVRQVAGAA
jgi:hypothetical protein